MAKLLALALLGLLAAPAALAADMTSTTIEKQKIFKNDNFPADSAARPPLPAFRTLGDAVAKSCTRVGTTIRLAITHKEIPNVNGTMMQWFWQNVATRSAISPEDNKAYPMFLLHHPRDHIAHTATKTPMATGATAYFFEFPLTGCTSTDGVTWACPTKPDGNPGFTKADNTTVWQFKDQVNATVNVQSLTKTAMRFRTRGCNDRNQCAWIIRTAHTWTTRKWTEADGTKKFGLNVKTLVNIGIGIGQYDTDIVNGWANGLDPMAKCWRQATHFVEETGTLASWLPAAYAARNSK